jgi:uncharacterized protein YbjT (DUF2867 family)
MTTPSSSHVLITGATGYVGGRLAPRLLEAGYTVRCMVRDPERLQGRPWHQHAHIVVGDVFDSDSLIAAMKGVHTAFYLIHSMGGGGDFHQRDLTAARNFGFAARNAGVSRIIYLGGLTSDDEALSEHLLSRRQTGTALREAGVPVTEFRAGVIVGSGSLSFEIIRYLTERVPVMICPRWVYTRTQPIGIRDVLDYLAAVLSLPDSSDRIIEIGGADVITYGEMMTTYAEVRGLRRWMLPVPVLTPRLSSLWVDLVTPVPAVIARPLIEGLRNENVVRDFSAKEIFPHLHPADYRTSVERALQRLQAGNVETAWSDALASSRTEANPVILSNQEGMILEQRQITVTASPAAVFRAFAGLGGARGWLYMNWAWLLRGFVDRLVGGVGLRRGRRDADYLRVGDALDFWRVEAVEESMLLRLRAEMKLPGKAWLQFQTTELNDGECLLTQTAFFAPKGLAGWLYWYALYPLHALIFSGLVRKLANAASGTKQVSQPE